MTQTNENPVPIVGIGASAGGIEALEHFFRATPATIGCAFVIITHLNPKMESQLVSIVQRWTEMPVERAGDDVLPKAGRVYVMPESTTLKLVDGRFELTTLTSHREYAPIDLFLSSLALDLGERAIAVILSGSDGDGTLGVKAVKERGGLTLAQVRDGTVPKYPSMPETAIASGMIDCAIPVQDMPARIESFVRGLETNRRVDGDDAEIEKLDALRGEIYALLRGQTGHDFSGYKTKTFYRRMQRRREILQFETFEAYVARLRQDPSEVAALFRDLLINVTNFFRDRDAFEALKEKVIPAIFDKKQRGDTVRVWVPGCATGEEVYTLAILMREHMGTLEISPRVQIFATDIDERSLEAARAARYPEPLLDSVSPERRDRFFVREGSSFIVSKEVRELCVFSPHSLIRDPPFSRMDMVSCRNLLIYLTADLQGQVLPLFHYSLRPNGFLFLGTAENIGQSSDLFTPVDKKQRIFRARENAEGSMRLPIISRSASNSLDVSRTPKAAAVQTLLQAIDTHVMERFVPAHVVINAEGDVVHFSGHTGRYLEPAEGMPSRQLLSLARKGVRLELRGAIRDALGGQVRVERHNLTLEGDDGRLQTLSLVIEPLVSAAEEPLFIVMFVDAGPPVDRLPGAGRALLASDENSVVVAIERELKETRDRLQSMVEEYETALEELKSSNEELVSVNEELQSTNEELEASKEELQSLNEEMQTVNVELGHKIEELDDANADLRNLFDTSKIASVFVNGDLSIRNFTPLAGQIFDLLPGDRGRSMRTFSGRLIYTELIEDLLLVIRTKEPVERCVSEEKGAAQYLVRIQPYEGDRGTDAHAGATMTFVDITSLAADSPPPEPPPDQS